jgi:glycine C-acetyltransferase
MDFLAEKVNALKSDGVFRKLNILQSPNDALEVVNGFEVINLCSNNYLGFANHPRLKEVAIKAIEKYGVGAGAVRTINGNTDLHEQLDLRLAKFKAEERVHHFQSGLNCNMGAICLIAEEGDLILSDELNHASIIDGTRLSKASKKVYKHCDMEHLESILKAERLKYKKVLIISDGVFSMDGNIAPLRDLVKIAKSYEALTYIDDAHGSGVLGKSGRGTIDHFNLHKKVDFIVGTLSKAIGSIGGYIAGSENFYDFLNHRARPLLFSTALPPASVAVSIEAISMLEESDEYSKKLWDNTKFFQNGLKDLGFSIGKTQTPITPIHVGDENKALEVAKFMFERGVYVSPIVFPTVPKGTARIRCMLNANHTSTQLQKVIDVFVEVRDKFNI